MGDVHAGLAQAIRRLPSGRAFRWEVRPDAWSRKACEVAGRELTRLEWEDALPERDYRSVCE